MGEHEDFTKEEKKRIVTLFKQALLDDNEELFFRVLRAVISNWYLITTRHVDPRPMADALKEAEAGGN